MASSATWEMKFDLNTLEHLGVRLYTQYPPMIAELISNSWDADADNVSIDLFDTGSKKIVVKDDGDGMTKDELNAQFLLIGRNRRVKEGRDTSNTKGRPVLGKKGIGKLSMFGIAQRITVSTIKNQLKNSFTMDYELMKKSSGIYNPVEVAVDEATDEPEGTTITLEQIKRKSKFRPVDLANSLARRFSIFDEINVKIRHNDVDAVDVQNKDPFADVDQQFVWDIPDSLDALVDDPKYFVEKGVCGKLKTARTPLKKNQQGVTLLARGKLVQENAYFDDRSNDYFHSYLYGTLNVDFIDEDNETDHVSTDRKSLVWEGAELELLRSKLNDILNAVSRDWRKKRQNSKKIEFKKRHGVDIEAWLTTLTPAESPLARKIANSVMNNTTLSDAQSIGLFGHIQDVFSLQGFKDFAARLDEIGVLDEGNAIKLLEDWQMIEAKELAKISEGRISTINQFEKYIMENASETKVMQKFLEQFPWILDPRMTSFSREVTYSAWLKEHFPDDKLETNNRRIDFLCSNNDGVLHVIELKRPNIKLGIGEIEQCTRYKEFMEDKCPDSIQSVRVILISENHKFGEGVKTIVEALRKNGDFEIKKYSDLLAQAKQYHMDFINKYDELLSMKSNPPKSTSP